MYLLFFLSIKQHVYILSTTVISTSTTPQTSSTKALEVSTYANGNTKSTPETTKSTKPRTYAPRTTKSVTYSTDTTESVTYAPKSTHSTESTDEPYQTTPPNSG